MVASKIQNEQEVLRWFAEGRTYTWMIDEYRRKYNIETTPSLWGGFRRRRGLPRRITRDDALIPWFVKEEHRWEFPIQMLRAEARRRAGTELDAENARKLTSFLQRLEQDGTVVHYDPDTDEGFFYVPRRDGIDTDIIRVPEQKTTARPRID
jgi:hypothetical protein